MTQPNARGLLIVVVVLLAIAAVYGVVNGPDNRTATQKVGDAIHELPNGVDKSMDELKDDRTPGQKIGDDVRHMGDKIKENSAPSQQ
jgi:hypothetical protein